ncbi:MAG: Lin0512 family protein [Pseudomonadota bacterium]
MSDQRFILEMGMGNDQYGQDMTKAAARAIEDAIRHSSIPLFDALKVSHDDMRVKVTIGVPTPEDVDATYLAAQLPRGNASVEVVEGGLRVPNPETGGEIIIAQAAVEAFLPKMTAKWVATKSDV